MFIDSHCHLTFPDFQDRMPDVLAAMAAADVLGAVVICTTLEEFDAVHALAMQHDHLWATVGVHPDNENVLEPDVDTLVRLSGRPKVIGVGETGLDYFRLGERTVADMQWQRNRFVAHIAAARVTNKPLVIHTRQASDDTLQILRDHGQGSVRGVFHCFTETMDVARAALDLGFYVSMSGIVTFKNAVDLKAVAKFVPADRLLIETDSPFLAPVPFRGKTNEPAYVAHVAAHVADLRGVSVATLGEQTSANFQALFGVQPRQPG